MDRAAKREAKSLSFDPSGVGEDNGHFIGLPWEEDESEVVVMAIPWDVTVSYGAGTADGPGNVLRESLQLDLEDSFVADAWKKGLFVRPPDEALREKSRYWRSKSAPYLSHLENGGSREDFASTLGLMNEACEQLQEDIYKDAQSIFNQGQTPGLLGGDHSTPFGLIRASVERFPALGILQVDAHMDLRKAYEGFTWSHASIFYNVTSRLPVRRLVQVGIRDYCEEERQWAALHPDKIHVYRDRDMARDLMTGQSFFQVCQPIIASLPEHVHVSFDIDGLDPGLCPGTGTPVPGGFQFQQAVFLLELIIESGRRIVSFDLCETGGADPWDANVGARMLYKLANLAG